MLVRRLVVGPLGTNCYVVADEVGGTAAVIDPGDEATRIIEQVNADGLRVAYVIDTHAHSDHIGANAPVVEAYGARLVVHKDDADSLADPISNISAFVGGECNSPVADVLVGDGDELKLDGLTLTVLHTPGHTPGSIVVVAPEAVFSGDTLFAGSVGRTDLPGGSAGRLAESLKCKIMPLGDNVVVYPGHGETSTIGREKLVNPFLQGD